MRHHDAVASSKLRVYALFAAAHGVVVLAVLMMPDSPSWLLTATLAAALPFVFAWGHFHVDLARNPELDETERNRWRTVFYLLPWSMALYWTRYVRPRQCAD
jgi:hypothetical protein